MCLAGLDCGQYLKRRVGAKVLNDSGEGWLYSKPGEGCGYGQWLDFVEGLLPVKEKEIQGVLDCLCLFHERSDDVDGLWA